MKVFGHVPICPSRHDSYGVLGRKRFIVDLYNMFTNLQIIANNSLDLNFAEHFMIIPCDIECISFRTTLCYKSSRSTMKMEISPIFLPFLLGDRAHQYRLFLSIDSDHIFSNKKGNYSFFIKNLSIYHTYINCGSIYRGQ